MNRIVKILGIVLIVLLISSCGVVNYSTTKADVSMSPSKGKVVGQARNRGNAFNWLFTIIPANVDVAKKLGLTAGQKVANLTISQVQTFGNLLASGLTFGLVNPQKVTITADVVE